MGTTANSLIDGVDREAIVDRLVSMHAYELVAAHWATTLRHGLEGQALFLIGDELEEVAAEQHEHAEKIAERVASLGGRVTEDPGRLVAVSPVESFEAPRSYSEVGVILTQALEHVQGMIRGYGDLLDRVAGRDWITFALVVKVLGHHAAREDDLEGSLVAAA